MREHRLNITLIPNALRLALIVMLSITSAWSVARVSATHAPEPLQLSNQYTVTLDSGSPASIDISDRFKNIATFQRHQTIEWLYALKNGANQWTNEPTHNHMIRIFDHAQWYAFRLSNPTSKALDKTLVVKNPLIDSIDIFIVRDHAVRQAAHLGESVAFNERTVQHRHPTISVTLPPRTDSTVYIQMRDNAPTHMPLWLYDTDTFHAEEQTELMFKGLFYGTLLAMMLYSLLMFSALKERAYLFLAFNIFSFACFDGSLNGFTAQFIAPSATGFQPTLYLFGIIGLLFFSSQLTLSFLNIKQLLPKLSLAIQGASYTAIALGLSLVAMEYASVLRALMLISVPTMALWLAAALVQYNQGQKTAGIYALSWSGLFVSGSLFCLSSVGLLPAGLISPVFIELGMAFQLTVVFIALAKDIDNQRVAKVKAQEHIAQMTQQRLVLEEKMHYETTHDYVTGYPNRSQLQNAFGELKNKNTPTSAYRLLVLKSQRIQEISKTLGPVHSARIQRTIAERLNALLLGYPQVITLEVKHGLAKKIAILESLVIAMIVRDDEPESFSIVIEQAIEAFAHPIQYENLMFETPFIGGHVGLDMSDEHLLTALNECNIALDVCEEGNDKVVEYSESINPYSEKRLTLMAELRHALEDDHLSLHFQPKIDLEQEITYGFEALVRWNSPTNGFIPPDEFIPLAERTGTIQLVTHWVINQALRKMSAIHTHYPTLSVSVNISANDLKDDGFVAMVKSSLDRHNFPPEQLCLEVTETAAMQDPQQSIKTLTELSELGVKLSIDDFGTGHASLAYIRQLPITEIKIDRSFVMEMDQENDDAIIVEATIAMCQALGREIVAEGIENQTSLNHLKLIGCDYGQGFHIARPMSFDDLKEWLKYSAWVKYPEPKPDDPQLKRPGEQQ